MYRLFVAIDFPESIVEHIMNICRGVRGARWVPREQVHLTLRFIGSADERLYHDITDALADITFGSFCLRLSGTGHFPPRKPPRVLWVGVDHAPELHELASVMERALRSVGVEPEKRRFHPHVTVARLSERVRSADVSPFLSGTALFRTEPIQISQFHLYSSLLRAEGALHRIESSFALL